jgi:O-antigen/teichoic acid export membrane protein
MPALALRSLKHSPSAILRHAIKRPTWFAQAINALSSLALVALLTRFLPVDDYATYATVLATYAFGNALVGTTIGTRAIEDLSGGGLKRIRLSIRRDLPPMLTCLLAASATTLIVEVNFEVALAAAAGMFGILTAEMGGAYVLGLQRYWTYATLVFAQVVLWTGAVVLAIIFLPPSERLSPCLIAVAFGSLPAAAYLAAMRGMTVVRGRVPNQKHAAISAVGVTNLALWVLASGDRIILAHYALAALATYAAIYGLLDRAFRTVANAEIQQRLPSAFVSRAEGRKPQIGYSRRDILILIGAGCTASVGAPSAIAIISGGHYHPPLAMSTVLAFAMIVMLAGVPTYVLLIAQGRTMAVAVVAVSAAAVNIVGNLVFASRFGTSSATALTFIGYAIWLVGITMIKRTMSTKDESMRTAQSALDVLQACSDLAQPQ